MKGLSRTGKSVPAFSAFISSYVVVSVWNGTYAIATTGFSGRAGVNPDCMADEAPRANPTDALAERSYG